MITETVFYAIAIPLAIGLAFGLFYVLRRLTMKTETVAILAIGASVVTVSMVKMMGTTNVYVIEPGKENQFDVTQYVNFSESAAIEIPGQAPQQLALSGRSCAVVNRTTNVFYAEEHTYGTGFSFSDDERVDIAPMSAALVPGSAIDYMPGEEVPSSVSVSKGSSSATKWSLRAGPSDPRPVEEEQQQ